MPAALLPDRALIRLSGPDAEKFLQNLITTDLDSLPQGEAMPAALLTPQGKIQFAFMIWRDGADFIVDTQASNAEAMSKRLAMYKLRSKVEISNEPSDGVTVTWGDIAGDDAVVDMRFAAAGIPVMRQAGKHGDYTIEGYHALRVLAGVPETPFDFALDDVYPHDVMMDLNAGVSFKKGCYVGQEVVSRMQHRGTARRRLVIVTAEAPLPAAGTEITAGGKPLGTLGTIAGKRGLSIVRIDRAGDAMASETPILAGEVPVALTLAGWTGLSFPQPSEES